MSLDRQGRPVEPLRMGVRIFKPGVEGSALDIERGKDQSKAVARRAARLQRRQLRRRTARQRDLFRLLQEARLLPDDEGGASSDSRNRILARLDMDLIAKHRDGAEGNFAELPLYILRKRALDWRLEPHEIGRVLFHLSQRRGFKSNRKEVRAQKEGEDLGQVNAAIGELWDSMKAAEARTLGEYLAGLNPHIHQVRRIWTARAMFEQEFDRIWREQQTYHAELLTPELRQEVARLLFFQRPIAAQSHLVGECELERDQKRAPWAALAAQRFRVLQKVNDLRLQMPDGSAERPLNADERHALLLLLNREGTKSFVQIKSHLALPKHSRFNVERGEEKSLPGNRTEHSMRQVFGDRWDTFSEGKQNQIVENWRNSTDDESLRAEAQNGLGLDADSAARLQREQPQDGYCALSLQAIARLLPLMEGGQSFKEAETEVYGTRFSGLPVHDRIPTVQAFLPNLRNPAVERALTEVRKVVNAIVSEYGKPSEVRIELARELKKPRTERAQATANNRKREVENKKLADRMVRECGLHNPSRKDMEKGRLYVECGGTCAYTGRSIPFSELFNNSEFDVEHILPRSRHPDDSFQNKTLCWMPENRQYKRNQTPWETYAGQEERWAQILERVKKWGNPGKLRRFMVESEKELGEFSARQLNDTRYTSVLAARLIGSLYGGRDVDGRQVVFSSSGAVTATLRRSWGLELILRSIVPSEPEVNRTKPRTDHRHHAVDALVIALTCNGVIQQMAQASALEPWQEGQRSWHRVPQPWQSPAFLDSARQQIEQMMVSHRPEHKVSGELHQGSNYARPYKMDDGKNYVHIRVALGLLGGATGDKKAAAAKVECIVDPVVRTIVRAKLEELGGDPKLFGKPENAPRLPAGPGRTVPIKKVRVRESRNPIPVGQGPRERWVASGGIHHIELFVTRDAKRREVWCSDVVQITEAYERVRRKQPVVARSIKSGDGEFLFSLAKDDTIEMEVNGTRRVLRVKKFADNGQIWFVPVNDAHDDSAQKSLKLSWSLKPNTLKERAPRKVVVDLLGRVRAAND